MEAKDAKISITIRELEIMLSDQKKIVVTALKGQSGYYNKASDVGHYISLDIDEEKFMEVGMKARYPDEFNVLKKYIN